MSFSAIISIEIAVGILAIGFLFYFAKNKATRRTEMRNIILQEQASSFGNAVWFPVRYSSRKRFHSIWKFFVWETGGVMFLDKGSIFFFPENQINHPLVFNLSSSEAYLNWVGIKMWPNGFLYWFSIMSDNETHYFTSETRTFIFTSKWTTEDIYNKLQEYTNKIKSA
jgi:hypothetical protein